MIKLLIFLSILISNMPIASSAVGQLTITPNSLDFGILTSNGSKVESLDIKNETSSPIAIEIGSLSYFEIFSNSCQAILPASQSCKLKIKLNAKTTAGSISETLSINNQSINLLASVEENNFNTPSDVTANFTNITESLAQPQKLSKEIIFTNNSSKNFTNITTSISSPFAITSNTCTGNLKTNQSCSMIVNLDSAPLAIGNYSTILKLISNQKSSQLVNFNINIYIPCSLQNAVGYGVNSLSGVLSVTGNAPTCSVASCLPNYELSNDHKSCHPKQCLINQDLTNTNPFISNYTGISSIFGDYVNGCHFTCDGSRNYYKNITGLSCDYIRDCNIEDLTEQGINTSLYSSILGKVFNTDKAQCSITCPQNYSFNSIEKACTRDCNLNDASSIGYNLEQAISPIGQIIGSNASSCSIQCSSKFSLNSNTKTCEKNCEQADYLLNNVNIQNSLSLVGIVSGNNQSQCLIQSCLPGYQLAADLKSCQFTPINCELSDLSQNGYSSDNVLAVSGQITFPADYSQCIIEECETSFVLQGKNCISNSTTDDVIAGYTTDRTQLIIYKNGASTLFPMDQNLNNFHSYAYDSINNKFIFNSYGVGIYAVNLNDLTISKPLNNIPATFIDDVVMNFNGNILLTGKIPDTNGNTADKELLIYNNNNNSLNIFLDLFNLDTHYRREKRGFEGTTKSYLVESNQMFFSGQVAGQGFEPWVYDGVIAKQLCDINRGSETLVSSISSKPEYFTRNGSSIFFTASTTSDGRELYEYNELTKMCTSRSATPVSTTFRQLTSLNKKLLMICNTTTFGSEPCFYDVDTAQITYMDINPGMDPYNGLNFSLMFKTDDKDGSYQIFNNKAYFLASTGFYNRIWSLYETDGTLNGTKIKMNVTPFVLSYTSWNIKATSDYLYFVNNNNLWVLDKNDKITECNNPNNYQVTQLIGETDSKIYFYITLPGTKVTGFINKNDPNKTINLLQDQNGQPITFGIPVDVK